MLIAVLQQNHQREEYARAYSHLHTLPSWRVTDYCIKSIPLSISLQVKYVEPGGVADREGQIKRGDKLVLVDGHSMSRLTKKECLQILKKTGLTVELLMSRKVGHSVAPSQVASRKPSRQVSVTWKSHDQSVSVMKFEPNPLILNTSPFVFRVR